MLFARITASAKLILTLVAPNAFVRKYASTKMILFVVRTM
ncbi:hypothetical protein B4U79_09677 [Dinothrombium tinctorium]|uniref:Uncharacterized protein n=1 Tax=Dinothrombium tinctorium TaxID=1965070 RepID=A0A3S3SLD2_9ACAR|nr:hypothetical protein B4U79_09677 [Dinothrombium tinctorium]